MLTIPPGLKIYIATQPQDMRKSFDGLAATVTHHLKKETFSGHVFVFFNKRCNLVKLLYWDRNGYCVWSKRLEEGKYRLPKMGGKTFNVSPVELGMLLEGIDLTTRSRLRTC